VTQQLPDAFQVPTRESERAAYKRDYALRNPGADMSGGSLPDVDAQVMADTTAPIYYLAQQVGNAAALDNMTTSQLTTELTNIGSAFLPAYPSSGEITVACNASGTTIPYGSILLNTATQIQYRTTSPTGIFQNGAPCAVQANTTGPGTNVFATTPATSLQWLSAPVGCLPTALIIAQENGTGLSGGSNPETHAQAIARIRAYRANPPASGNDAEYQTAILATPLVPVQQGFTYPSIKGPGTMGFCFTLVPPQSGGNRIPNPAQIAAVLAWVQGQMPGSDVPLACTIVASTLVVVLKVQWSQGATGWADASPWPAYASPVSSNGVRVVAIGGGAPTTPTAFALNGSTITKPQVGQSVAFLDMTGTTPTFRRKVILTVTADSVAGWDIVVDTTTAASDLGYTPVVGQCVCPWSDSLQSLVPPVLAYFDTVGPGEQKATFFDLGLRQKRSPASPGKWPSVVSNRLLGVPAQVPVAAQQSAPPPITLFGLPTLGDVVLQEPTVPYATPVGSAGVSSHLLTLSNLLAFPE